MLEVPNRTSRYLQSLLNRVITRLIRNDNITSLREGGDDATDGVEGLGVHDACGHVEEVRDIGFRLDVHVLGAVEAGRAAGTDAVGAQSADGLVFEVVVVHKVEDVVAAEVEDGFAGGEFDFGAGGAVGG